MLCHKTQLLRNCLRRILSFYNIFSGRVSIAVIQVIICREGCTSIHIMEPRGLHDDQQERLKIRLKKWESVVKTDCDP